MKEKVLIIRSSALGDVAMTLPVIYPLALAYKETEFYFLSLPSYKSILLDCPKNLHFIAMEKEGKHKGIKGIFRLYKELLPLHFTHIADLHSVWYSWGLVFLLRHSLSCRVASIDKGRKEKKHLLEHSAGAIYPLKTTFQRYAEVFAELGFQTGGLFTPFYVPHPPHEGEYWIGVAPFAKHKEKCYPVERMEEVVGLLSQYPFVRIFLFGGGGKEKEICEQWERKFSHTFSMIGKGDLQSDMRKLGEIDVVLSMDSANMHLASLMGTRVVSLWGATHPFIGFYGYGQRMDDFLWSGCECSPCSVFGNTPCKKGTYECMQKITPEEIVRKLLQDVRE